MEGNKINVEIEFESRFLDMKELDNERCLTEVGWGQEKKTAWNIGLKVVVCRPRTRIMLTRVGACRCR